MRSRDIPDRLVILSIELVLKESFSHFSKAANVLSILINGGITAHSLISVASSALIPFADSQFLIACAQDVLDSESFHGLESQYFIQNKVNFKSIFCNSPWFDRI